MGVNTTDSRVITLRCFPPDTGALPYRPTPFRSAQRGPAEGKRVVERASAERRDRSPPTCAFGAAR